MRGLSRWMERRLGALAVAGFRRPVVALGVALALLAGGAWTARDIRLSADLTELLPSSFDSVQSLEALKERFGGIGYVVVVGRGGDEESLRRFADDLAPKLATLDEIRWVDHKRSTGFFADRALYYLSVDDLEEVRDRIRARERWERRQRNPLFVQLEESEPPPLDFSDLEEKYGKGSAGRLAGAGDGYYLDPDKRMVVLLAKPAESSADLDYSHEVLGQVQGLLDQQDLSSYGEDFDVALTGTFQKKIDQQKQITGDVATASSVALLLMLGYLFFHFRSVVAVAMGLAPVGLGLVLTYGVVGIAWGQVNLLTAFLGAILGGLGIEHGMHLIGRYQTERWSGTSAEGAVEASFSHTGSAALVSAVVAALTFLSIAVSEFRAFREFGVIAAIGMILLVASYVLVLPAMISLSVRLGIEPKTRALEGRWMNGLGLWVERWRKPLALIGGTALILVLAGLASVRFDYDFGALEDGDLPSFQLDREVNRILGHSQTPVVLLTDSEDDALATAAEIRSRKRALGDESTVDFVGSLADLVPAEQEEKQAILASISRTLRRVDREKLDPELQENYDRFVAAASHEPFGLGDLPKAIRRQFEGISGESGFVLVYPSVSLSDGTAVRALAQEVRGIELPSGANLAVAGEALVLADILEMVTSEAPIVLAAALLSVMLAMWLTLGSLRTAALCMAPTVASVLGLAGVMGVTGLPFNYLNILVVPVLIGVTVDAGVHLMVRLSHPDASFVAIYAETGRAIVGGLLTSAFGFGALMLANHPGLASVGILANLGFTVNMLVMLFVFPSVLLLRNQRRADAAPIPVPVEQPSARNF